MKLTGPRILMAVHLSTDDPFSRRRTLHGFSVWELQEWSDASHTQAKLHPMYSWVEVARTPSTFSFWYELLDPPRFLYSSTMICMTGEYHKHVDDKSSGYMGAPKRYLRPLAYDLMHDCWFLLPFFWINSQELLIFSSFRPSFPGLVP
ncbi:hypothetical protein GOP47_0021188 [Adiantum capillus-veneris]|uniref:Uncharacterized protein n=1 Tax=Adiantum capillus-veneris TaxID=13818 RepID=A0A9D4UBL7_ADICA|nr:hypothetical protein GOP47_0021188 [Adiantum capillus-veneris]